MSRPPIAPDADIERLREEGFDVELRGTYLLVKDVPYVTAQREVRRGVLICSRERNEAGGPQTHVAYWTGTHPCHSNGAQIAAFHNPSPAQSLGDGIQADHMFYRDFHHKVTTYIARIEGEAQVLEPQATAKTFPVRAADSSESVFKYMDWASARAGLGSYNDRLASLRIGIIGLGGTGAYVLDLLAKSRVGEIKLFDGDRFKQHNAFRAPGAASPEDLAGAPPKVSRWSNVYSRMRNGIVEHAVMLGDENLALLNGLDFVFLCLDAGGAKRAVVEHLERAGVPFIEAGMGVLRGDEGLTGLVRVVTSTTQSRERARAHISFAEGDAVNEYSTNTQIVELNALSAALAVIRFKKHFGFYADSAKNYYEGYSIRSGDLVRESMT
jgi:hypothetical protein